MITKAPISITQRLNERRQALGMSYAVLAERSGVSEPTVKRILGGHATEASFGNVAAVAGALGMSVELSESDADSFLLKQATEKARRVARMVQGTSALESQAVDADTYERLVNRSVHELLAGSRRRLWSR